MWILWYSFGLLLRFGSYDIWHSFWLLLHGYMDIDKMELLTKMISVDIKSHSLRMDLYFLSILDMTFHSSLYIMSYFSARWRCELLLIHCYLDYTSKNIHGFYYICHNMRVIFSIYFLLLHGRHLYYSLLYFSCYSW